MLDTHKEMFNCETALPFLSQLDSSMLDRRTPASSCKKIDRRFRCVSLQRSRKMESSRTGHWLPEENAKYLAFLQEHRARFYKRKVRKTGRIFKLMEEAIGTRSSIQCRSHHQKMQLKFSNLEQIVHHLSSVTQDCQEPSYQENTSSPLLDSLVDSKSERMDQSSSAQEEEGEYYLMPEALEPCYRQIEQGSIRLRLLDQPCRFLSQTSGSLST